MEVHPSHKNDRGREIGMSLTKAPNSNQVINIIPPRSCWGAIQSIRSLSLPNQRCGPHFSFVEPFVLLKHYEEAAKLLREALLNVQPFNVTLSKLSYFSFKNSAMLYLEPTFEPEDGLEKLLSAVLDVFPQCTDQLRNGKYTAHMSIARFSNVQELLAAKQSIEQRLEPVTFTVKEIYLLNRFEGDPFEVAHVVPLGEKVLPPYFGPGSPESAENDESQLGRTVLVCGLRPGMTDEAFRQLIKDNGFDCTGVEVCLNPNGKPRTCGIVEFQNRNTANLFVSKFQAYDTIYVKPMHLMVYPGLLYDECSLKATKKDLHLYPWAKK